MGGCHHNLEFESNFQGQGPQSIDLSKENMFMFIYLHLTNVIDKYTFTLHKGQQMATVSWHTPNRVNIK